MSPTQLEFENFEGTCVQRKEVLLPRVYPIWTKHKASLIQKYLFLFVLVTKHGTYIDGFSGPQRVTNLEAWSARLVLENEPRRLRRFFLFEMNKAKIKYLEDLKKNYADVRIKIYHGDFNVHVHEFLKDHPIKDSEATFCLLDQRTFQCDWSSVVELAKHKSNGYKIELFYFLPIAWLDRSIKGLKYKDSLRKWWGRDDYHVLFKKNTWTRAELFKKRFEDELGYRHVKPWAFYSKPYRGKILYFMIHASDHPEAPKLMHRAYCEVVRPVRKECQELMF